MRVGTLLAGGGLAGLACARVLAQKGRPYLLVEKEKEPGGLCRTILSRGFTFDYTGHFLHFQDPGMKDWVQGLLGGHLKERRRHAAIHSHGNYTEYPYQENNAGLPSGIVRENVLGYLEAQLHHRAPGKGPAGDFLSWCLENFGPGLTRNFMEPYNRKIWKFPLDRLTTHWMGRFVPRPQVARVVEGASRKRPSAAGYNATFLYPDEGGISVLPRALAKGLPNLWFGTALAGLDPARKRARLSNGFEVEYQDLVTSLPLPSLAARTRNLPGSLRRAASGLKATSIYNVNLGLKGRQPVPYSWVYFPGSEFLFHRAGSVSACVPAVAPRGHYSLYVEFSYRGKRPDPAKLGRHALEALRRLGWIRSFRDLVTRVDLDLPGAYVIYDRHREGAVEELLAWYRKQGVLPVGRYGRWEYGSMESALAQGLEAAESILKSA